MRYEVLLLMLSCGAALLRQHRDLQATNIAHKEKSEVGNLNAPHIWLGFDVDNVNDAPKKLNPSRYKRHVNSRPRGEQKHNAAKRGKARRDAIRLKRRLHNTRQLRKAIRKRIMSEAAKDFRERPSKSLRALAQDRQDELLASVDDLPSRSATVEISVSNPGLCKVDGAAMCKHEGECNSRDEGGAPVFFCTCSPAWSGDFCQEAHDPCSLGDNSVADCGSMFSCRRDQTNTLTGFSCGCDQRPGWGPRSVSDPRCRRIARCEDGNPCRNGGACRQEEGGFACVCPHNTWGDLCQQSAAASDAGWAHTRLVKPAASQVSALLRTGSGAAAGAGAGARAGAGVGAGAGAGRPRRRRHHHHHHNHHQHADFLEHLLRDVEPQIRRTARDSVVELPDR